MTNQLFYIGQFCTRAKFALTFILGRIGCASLPEYLQNCPGHNTPMQNDLRTRLAKAQKDLVQKCPVQNWSQCKMCHSSKLASTW